MSILTALAIGLIGISNGNLVRNGSFEDNSGSLSGWREGSIPPNATVPVNISIDTGVAKEGKSSLRFEKTEQRFFPVAMLSQSIGSPSTSKIKLGMWVKAATARKATMGVIFAGAEAKEWGAYVGEANTGDRPADHDWKHYSSVLAVPSGTNEVVITLEMYGPGTVWIDGVSAEFVPGDTPVMKAVKDTAEDPLADVKDVASEDLKAGGDPMKRYFLIGAKKDAAQPQKLLVVLPGGDGSADFNPFLRRVWKNALPEGYVMAQLVAPKWSEDQFQSIVWPTKKHKWQTMKFSTEEFVDAVVKDAKSNTKIDEAKVFTLSWSSGGPAAYAISLSGGPVRGSLIAMSVYKPDQLPSLLFAKGHAYYLLHSPEDFIPIAMPRKAVDELGKAGAKITLETYPGGHGWTSDPFGNIRKGIEWLEKNAG